METTAGVTVLATHSNASETASAVLTDGGGARLADAHPGRTAWAQLKRVRSTPDANTSPQMNATATAAPSVIRERIDMLIIPPVCQTLCFTRAPAVGSPARPRIGATPKTWTPQMDT